MTISAVLIVIAAIFFILSFGSLSQLCFSMFPPYFMVQDLITTLVTVTAVTALYFKRRFKYWALKKLPYIEPSIPLGNFSEPTKSVGVCLTKLYKRMKKIKAKHCGFYLFAQPCYMVVDVEYVKNILVRDFQYFTDRGLYINEKDEPIGAHLFALGGTRWKNLRSKISPSFMPFRIKRVFESFLKASSSMIPTLEEYEQRGEPVDIKEILNCYTIDIIGDCAFGLECNSFKEENSPFLKYSKKVFAPTALRNLLSAFYSVFPDFCRRLKIRQLPKDVGDFFMKTVTDSVIYREKNGVIKNDFLQLLIDMKNKDDGLTIEEICAQSFVFFAAGFETSATTMSFALYELAKNEAIQNRLREEIDLVLQLHQGKITYESIHAMTYMNQVVDETLRKYPPAPFITRKCVKDYKIPDEDITIEEGTPVFISILGIQHDEEYYPNPSEFDPERFNEENKKKRRPYVNIPFGEGPRICIGRRFGLIESKVGIAKILSRYKLSVNPKTKEPLKIDTKGFIPKAIEGIWLDIQKKYQ